MYEQHLIYRIDNRKNLSLMVLGTVKTGDISLWVDIANRAVEEGIVTEPGTYLLMSDGGIGAPSLAAFDVVRSEAPLKVVV